VSGDRETAISIEYSRIDIVVMVLLVYRLTFEKIYISIYTYNDFLLLFFF
jgi:hypothetical protein